MGRSADLTLEGVGYRYPRGERDALREISTVFPGGGCSAVMGADGAGKSSLLKALTGIVPMLSGGQLRGRVRYGQADLAQHRVSTITEYIGLVLQDPASQVIGRTVAEDVTFGPRNHLVPREEAERRGFEALERVGLAGFEARATAELSGGELQRLAIAGVLALAPDVLCRDEATAELDPAGADQLWTVLDELRNSGMGIVLAEGDPHGLLPRAEHLVVLDQGALAWQGSPTEFFAHPEQAAALGVRPAPMPQLAASLLAASPGLRRPGRLPVSLQETADWLRETLGGRRPSSPATDRVALPSAPAAIELEGLRFSYAGGPEVLHGIDLTIGAGEFVALLGANGSGKTTLVKHLNGLLRPNAGRVRLLGRDTANSQIWQLAQLVGFVFQDPGHQLFCGTVADEVGYGLRMAGRASDEIRRRVAEVLEFTGLSDVAGQNPLTLPRSRQQLVAMASTLVSRPQVLVIDEPTTGQDWNGVQSLMSLVERLNAEGATIVMISHDQELVAQYAHRAITLSAGQVIADGPAATQVTTEVTRLWAELFGAAMPPPRDANEAGQLLAAAIREPR